MATETTERVSQAEIVPRGALTTEASDALRPALAAGGAVPAPHDGRALVLSVIGRQHPRVEASS